MESELLQYFLLSLEGRYNEFHQPIRQSPLLTDIETVNQQGFTDSCRFEVARGAEDLVRSFRQVCGYKHF